MEYIRDEPAEGEEDDAWWAPSEFSRVADCFSGYVYQRVLTYGGSREDRRTVSKLKPYGASLQFDSSGRAIECFVSPHLFTANGSPTEPRPIDTAAMELIRRLDRLEKLEIDSMNGDPSGWAVLRDHPTLARLEDRGTVDDAAVEHLCAMPALRSLRVSDRRLTHLGLARLLRGHPLNSLSLSIGEPPTALALSALEAQVGLERLDLNDRESALTDEALTGVAGLVSFKELFIDSKNITDNGLKYVAELSRLERLDLNRIPISDAGLAHFAGLTSLASPKIWHTEAISGAGFRHLGGLCALRSLDVQGLPIVDDALVHLAGFTGMVDLSLRETHVVGPGLRHLSRLGNIRKLSLRWCALVDEGMPHLAALSSLEDLDISGTKITDAGLRALAPLKSLRVLGLQNVAFSPAAIQELEAAIPGMNSRHW